ncbi:MAG TPA: asparagine synthase (glutamine-hydrolyzing) [Terriglobia bacterium]|nr:asparagine synthase (glutamine-hydrolyzing) [Terriglobia bacterium]
MSGIAGIFNLDGRPADLALLRSMTDAVSYRGPDGVGYWADGPVALGHRLLHATPESLGESQPLLDETGDLCLVLDGRVDNREELCAEVEQAGTRLRDRTDAELVLKAYACWDDECPARILGDFAFVVWDRRKRRLFCARDVLGLKPFYYYLDGHRFLCGSALHQLFEDASVPRRPNEAMIGEYLSLAPRSRDETLYEGIRRLTPAHSMTVEAGGVRTARYWDIDPAKQVRHSTDAEYAEHFLSIFKEAVRCRLRAHGPVGSELSGGVDSSSVVSVAQFLLRQEEPINQRLETFSAVFPGLPTDESEYAREVAARWGLEPNLVLPEKFSAQATRRTVQRFLDIPYSPTVVIADPLKARACEKGCRVLLTGQGGDDWLTGSVYQYADLLRQLKIRQCLRQIREDHRADLIVDPRYSLLYCGLRPLVPEGVRRAVRWVRTRALGRDGRPPWINPQFSRKIGLAERLRRDRARVAFSSYALRDMHDGLRSGWHTLALELIERHASEFRVDVRHPFHDRRLIEFAFAIPEEQRLRRGQSKFVLRQAMQGLLPDTVRQRVGKADGSHMYADALDALGAERVIDSLSIASQGWVDKDQVNRMYKEMAAARETSDYPALPHIMTLWTVFNLELWFNMVFLKGESLPSERLAVSSQKA